MCIPDLCATHVVHLELSLDTIDHFL